MSRNVLIVEDAIANRPTKDLFQPSRLAGLRLETKDWSWPTVERLRTCAAQLIVSRLDVHSAGGSQIVPPGASMAFLGNPLVPGVAAQPTRRPSWVFWLTLRCLMPFPTRHSAGGATVSGNYPIPWAWDYLTNLTRLLSLS